MRKAVDAATQLCDRGRIGPGDLEAWGNPAGPVDKQLPGLAVEDVGLGRRGRRGWRAAQRRHLPDLFAGDPQRLLACDEHPDSARTGQQPTEQLSHAVDTGLDAVEHDQRRGVAAQGRRDPPIEPGIVVGCALVNRGDVEVDDRQVGGQSPADLDRESGLADARRPGQRDERLPGDERHQLVDRGGATDERRQRVRQSGQREGRRSHPGFDQLEPFAPGRGHPVPPALPTVDGRERHLQSLRELFLADPELVAQGAHAQRRLVGRRARGHDDSRLDPLMNVADCASPSCYNTRLTWRQGFGPTYGCGPIRTGH